MVAVQINHRDLYFKYKILKPIRGELTFATLHHLLPELKSNAVFVHSTLEGGSHGFIEIILSAHTYTSLALLQPFILPVHPVPLQLVEMAT